MAVKIRLARAGAKKAPFYRVVAADARAPRDGRFIEILGRYNPRTEPSTIELDIDKVDSWLAKGAQPTEIVAKLIAIAKNPEPVVPSAEPKLSKKAKAKATAAAEKAAAPPEPKPAADEAEPAAEAEAVVEAAPDEAEAADPVEEPPAEAEDAADEPAE